VDTFCQEYPATDSEAFLFSGRPRFDLKSLAQMPAARRVSTDPAGMVGEIVEEVHGPKPRLIFTPNEERRGALTVYKRPRAGGLYSVGIDVAEGIDINEEERGNADPDYSVAEFVDIDTGEQAAKIRGRIEPAAFAEYVEAVARWYGELRDAKWMDPRTSCYLVPEANGPGIALIEALLRLGYPPWMIFHRARSPEQTFVSGDSTELQTLGWRTTAVTRAQLISFHDQCIRERSYLIYDPHTLAEHQSFIVDGRGKAQHAENCHDDEVIASALAMKGVETFPRDERLKIIRANSQKPAILHNSHSGIKRYGRRRGEERGTLVRL
jgi:hypothetical protein